MAIFVIVCISDGRLKYHQQDVRSIWSNEVHPRVSRMGYDEKKKLVQQNVQGQVLHMLRGVEQFQKEVEVGGKVPMEDMMSVCIIWKCMPSKDIFIICRRWRGCLNID